MGSFQAFRVMHECSHLVLLANTTESGRIPSSAKKHAHLALDPLNKAEQAR